MYYRTDEISYFFVYETPTSGDLGFHVCIGSCHCLSFNFGRSYDKAK